MEKPSANPRESQPIARLVSRAHGLSHFVSLALRSLRRDLSSRFVLLSQMLSESSIPPSVGDWREFTRALSTTERRAYGLVANAPSPIALLLGLLEIPACVFVPVFLSDSPIPFPAR